jgi:hypothetical protein
MQGDVEYLETRLSKVDGFGDTSQYLMNIVRSKKVDIDPVPEAKSSSETEPNGDTAKAGDSSTTNGGGELEKKKSNDK